MGHCRMTTVCHCQQLTRLLEVVAALALPGVGAQRSVEIDATPPRFVAQRRKDVRSQLRYRVYR